MPSPIVLLRLLIALYGFLIVLLLATPESLPEALQAYSDRQAAKIDIPFMVGAVVLLALHFPGLIGTWFAKPWGRVLFSLSLAAIPFFELAGDPTVMDGVDAFLDAWLQMASGAIVALVWLTPPVARLFDQAASS